MRTTGLPALLLLGLSPALHATERPAPALAVTAGRLTAAIVLDGTLAEPAWGRRQRDPGPHPAESCPRQADS